MSQAKHFKTSDNLELTKLIRDGGVGIMPTDTVYGLVCLASDETAVKRLYQLKARENKPGTIIAADIDQLVGLGIKARYLKAVEQFWPNSISIVIPSHELSYIHLGKGGIAVRVPKITKELQLLKNTGPLLTTSANLPGKPEAQNVQEAEKYFGETVDFFVDGGNISGQPSTVIRMVDDAVEILRRGAVKIDESTGKIL